jgi:hypothetical protein
MRDFSTKVDNTAPLASGLLTAAEDNVRFRELEQAVTTAGIGLDGSEGPDSDTTMLAQALARYASGGIVGQDSGAANAHVLSTVGSFVMPKAYFKGMMIAFYAGATNTGATTVNAWSLGAKKLLSPAGADLVAGEIIVGVPVFAIYDPALDGGAGAFKIVPWSVGLVSVGTGTAVYKGRDSAGRHQIRSILAGSNITIDLVSDNDIRINGAAGGGGGGGGSPHENVGTGAQVHKGNDGTNDELRTLLAASGGGLTVTQNTDDISMKLADIAAWKLLLRNAGSTGTPAAAGTNDLTVETAPALLDKFILGKAADGALRAVTLQTVRGGAGNWIPVAGTMSVSTGLATHVINSNDFSGASVALKPGDNLTARITFTTALTDTRYLVYWRAASGLIIAGVTKATTHLDLYLTSSGSVTDTLDVYIVKLA